LIRQGHNLGESDGDATIEYEYLAQEEIATTISMELQTKTLQDAMRTAENGVGMYARR
jgi:hypothetical protein